ncbi:hypothetical protein TNCV_2585401 [Trichonephila clavipes]|nr:hypothetical protein TNCV_2585401 [Trichonephila clavipes]
MKNGSCTLNFPRLNVLPLAWCLKLERRVPAQVVPCLREKAALSTVTFIHDGATSHTANLVKEFLTQTFGEEKSLASFANFHGHFGLKIFHQQIFGCGDSGGGEHVEQILQK